MPLVSIVFYVVYRLVILHAHINSEYDEFLALIILALIRERNPVRQYRFMQEHQTGPQIQNILLKSFLFYFLHLFSLSFLFSFFRLFYFSIIFCFLHSNNPAALTTTPHPELPTPPSTNTNSTFHPQLPTTIIPRSVKCWLGWYYDGGLLLLSRASDRHDTGLVNVVTPGTTVDGGIGECIESVAAVLYRRRGRGWMIGLSMKVLWRKPTWSRTKIETWGCSYYLFLCSSFTCFTSDHGYRSLIVVE